MCQEAILKVSVMGELINEEWIREDCQFKMGLEVREDHLVKDACWVIEQTWEVSSQRDEVRLKLSHGILSQASGTKAYTLAEGAYPAFVLATLDEIRLVLGFEAKGTELSTAYVVIIPKCFVYVSNTLGVSSIILQVYPVVLRQILLDHMMKGGFVRNVN